MAVKHERSTPGVATVSGADGVDTEEEEQIRKEGEKKKENGKRFFNQI